MASDELISVSVRIPRPLKERLEQIADNNYRSLAAQLLFVIDEFVREHDAVPAKPAASKKSPTVAA